MQDSVGGDYFRTPVIIRAPDIYRIVGGINGARQMLYAGTLRSIS